MGGRWCSYSIQVGLNPAFEKSDASLWAWELLQFYIPLTPLFWNASVHQLLEENFQV